MSYGLPPTWIGRPGVLLAVLIGVTVSASVLATYTVRPFGVIAIASGLNPTGIGRLVRSLSIEIALTVSDEKLETYAVFPFGVIAMSSGVIPTGIWGPAVFVTVLTGGTAAPLASTT